MNFGDFLNYKEIKIYDFSYFEYKFCIPEFIFWIFHFRKPILYFRFSKNTHNYILDYIIKINVFITFENMGCTNKKNEGVIL